MARVQGKQKHRFSLKVWLPSLAAGLAVIAVVIILPLSGHNTANTNTPAQSTTNQTAQQSTTGATSTGTDNASLEDDLNSIQGTLNQENSDQTSTNNAINDSQYEITVPTS